MSTVTTNGIDLYYERHGSGPVVVLIPGLGYDGWMWHKMIPGLAEHFQVISIDNRENVAEELRPGLTTLALPHYELGRRATDRLLDAIDGGTPIPTDVVKVPFTVVSRGSVGVRA